MDNHLGRKLFGHKDRPKKNSQQIATSGYTSYFKFTVLHNIIIVYWPWNNSVKDMGQVSVSQLVFQSRNMKMFFNIGILYFFSLQDQYLWIWKWQERYFWLEKQWMKLWIICSNKKWINLKVCSIYLFPKKINFTPISFLLHLSDTLFWEDGRIIGFILFWHM